MNKCYLLLASVLMLSCGGFNDSEDDDPYDLTSKFRTTLNVHEKVEVNSDGIITYNSVPWGGLLGTFRVHNLPSDWSDYESITFEFAEPAKAPVQIFVTERVKVWGKGGLTSLTCNFDGQNVTSIAEVALQSPDATELRVKRVYLTPATSYYEPTKIWDGMCEFGNWANGFVIGASQFADAHEGDKLEFIYTTDNSSTDITYWLFKTVLSGTDVTLDGNKEQLNYWGCATVAKGSSNYRISLTKDDVARLKEKGLFVNGYYVIVTRCNLLKKKPLSEKPNDEF